MRETSGRPPRSWPTTHVAREQNVLQLNMHDLIINATQRHAIRAGAVQFCVCTRIMHNSWGFSFSRAERYRAAGIHVVVVTGIELRHCM